MSHFTHKRLKGNFAVLLFWLFFVGAQGLVFGQYKPYQDLGPLFEDVQLSGLFPDSKTFPDCIPLAPPTQIAQAYQREKSLPGFDLKRFVMQYFKLPTEPTTHFKSDPKASVEEHIQALWPVLTRRPVPEQSSLLPLPHAYVVPGGRFREIYYWDSYFTMLGLQVSGQTELIQNMVDNFTHLIQTTGHIPNGNRSYYLSRSQPPFYALMLRVLAQEKGKSILKQYAPALQKEYDFWMAGSQELSAQNPAARRVVRMPNGVLLNRYWDDDPSPRPEAYKEDVAVAKASDRNPQQVYRHLRAAAESGWDFSSRWFGDGQGLETIETTDFIPLDLNALLYHLEMTLAEMAQLNGDKAEARAFMQKAKNRKQALLQYCWNAQEKFFYDYNWVKNRQSTAATLAAAFPLYFCMATKEQAAGVAQKLARDFLQTGGLRTTLVHTGQQWDAPNGWAPLQWISIQGLRAYRKNELADTITARWVHQNLAVFKETGKLTEKYNVEKAGQEGGGGEYPNQDGFGWTNGVLLRLLKDGTFKRK
ncbi:alpha,alpha-trehalase TreF [Nibribacter ruber]|uniref:Alpha,alpha-trehalase TreF n=1 Tax=Nibribacter ruber TaxID=2698458 RepID=A0A6P1NSP6_9BACT|nr:alpha,alpha-trehalase TreF [Nibribacter ruber]QHL86866.1 alpha,alpha-trehalase TreF [Nibribacter ruber]